MLLFYLQVKWFKGPTEGQLVEVKEGNGEKYQLISNKLHRSIKIHKTVEEDKGRYWCQVGKKKCSAQYNVIRK